MKRNLRGSVLALILCMGITGCGNAIPDMTQEQRTAISEYAIEKVLEYDTSKDSRLVDLSLYPEPTKEPEATPAPTPEGMDKVEDTPVVELEQEGTVTPSQALSLTEGVTLEFMGYTMADSYPEPGRTDSYMVVEAGSGEKLLVLQFQLLNGTGQEVSLDMIGEQTSYLVTVNNEYSHNALITLLDDDLSTFYGTLSPDEGRNLVLMAEFKEEEVLDVATIRLAVQHGEKTTMVNLK